MHAENDQRVGRGDRMTEKWIDWGGGAEENGEMSSCGAVLWPLFAGV